MFTPVAQQPNLGLGRPVFRFPSHKQLDTHTHTHARARARALGRTPLNEWSARCRGRYLHNTQQTQQTKNHNPSNQGAEDLRLRPQGHSVKTKAKITSYCDYNRLKFHPGERPVILKFFCNFSASLQANSGTVPHIKLKPLPSMSSPVYSYPHPSIRRHW